MRKTLRMPIFRNDSFLAQLPSLRSRTNCDTFIRTSNIQTTDDKTSVTKISFTKTSSKIPNIQKCHRLILASAGSNFLKMILNHHDQFEDDIHISMPEFDKTEIETFLRFVYGELEEIDQSLSICQIFLKSFELKKEVLEYSELSELNTDAEHHDYYEPPPDIVENGSDHGKNLTNIICY